jgi:gluconokinase
VIAILMGVCGCGKTTIGRALAEELRWPFLDADDFHPPANVAKMAAGTPLVDADRWPWLDRLADEMRAIDARQGNAIVACSALRQSYRDRLRAWSVTPGMPRFVFLDGDYATIAARLAARRHRYMPATLLASQFATLERPVDALVVDISTPIEAQIAAIRAALQPSPVTP